MTKQANIPPRRNFKLQEMLAKFRQERGRKLERQRTLAMFQHARAKRKHFKEIRRRGDGKLSDAERNNLIQDPEVQNM
ncbi:MAG: hypothetical protein ACLUKN_08300 [Bacilli bacterium]